MAGSLRSDFKILWRHVSPRRRRQLLALALLMPATALAELAMIGSLVPFLALLAGRSPRSFDIDWLNPAVEIATNAAGSPLMAAAMLFMFVAMVTAALRLALAWQSERFAYGPGHDVNVEIQRRLLYQPYLFHVARHSSELIAVLDKVEHLALNLALHLIQAIGAALIGGLILLFLFDLDARSAALAAALVLILYAILLGSIRGRLAKYVAIIGTGYEQRLQSVQESLGGIRDVILDQSQRAHLDRFAAIDRHFMSSRSRIAVLASAPRFLVETIGFALIALLAVIAAARPGGVLAALPILGALALGAQRLLPLASQLFGGWASLSVTRPFLGDVASLLELPINNDAYRISPRVLAREIRFDEVGFRYPGRDRDAVHGLNLAISRGQRVALAGATGSGKSTLADLLMGLIEPTTGAISIDGEALCHDNLSSWRASIAHVPQAIFLADDSIARNIAMGAGAGEPDMVRVRTAAGAAQLTGFIDQLPEGFDTRIGERGIRLSGGQRQRLALARAIYKDAPLLLLDEATSALDEATERAVFAALDRLTAEGRTIVIIAHRLSTIAKCDIVYQLEAGAIVRSGSFTDIFGPQNRIIV